MNTTPLPDAADLALTVLDDLAAARWAQVTARFDETMRNALSEDALAAAWAQIIGMSGQLERRGTPDVTRAGDLTMTRTPISLEAGDYVSRISFRDDKTIAGLHILTEGNA